MNRGRMKPPPGGPALVLALALLLALAAPGPAPAQSPFAGDPPPELVLPPVGGPFPDLALPPAVGASPWKAARLSEIPVRILIINVYNYFCNPCHREAPQLKALNGLIRRRGLAGQVALLSVAAGDDVEATEAFVTKHKADWPFYPDPDLTAHAQMGSAPVPHFFIVRGGPSPVLLDVVMGEPEQNPPAFLDRVLKAGQP